MIFFQTMFNVRYNFYNVDMHAIIHLTRTVIFVDNTLQSPSDIEDLLLSRMARAGKEISVVMFFQGLLRYRNFVCSADYVDAVSRLVSTKLVTN